MKRSDFGSHAIAIYTRTVRPTSNIDAPLDDGGYVAIQSNAVCDAIKNKPMLEAAAYFGDDLIAKNYAMHEASTEDVTIFEGEGHLYIIGLTRLPNFVGDGILFCEPVKSWRSGLYPVLDCGSGSLYVL